MYQLTIDSARAGTVSTSHTDQPAAHHALHRYAVAADVYLRMIQATEPHTSYDLIDLADRPHPIGYAVIEHIPAAAESLYYRAGEARHWIEQHRTAYTGYPARVLARARAAGANPDAARILFQEAASLAGVEPAPAVDPIRLDTVQHQARCAAQPLNPADLAGIVATTDTAQPTAITLTWWVALLTWGGSAA